MPAPRLTEAEMDAIETAIDDALPIELAHITALLAEVRALRAFVASDGMLRRSWEAFSALSAPPAQSDGRLFNDQCRACGKALLAQNRTVADGCPCNSPRGINHGFVQCEVCTCAACDPEETGSSRFVAKQPAAKACAIPAKTIPPCDLGWGHDGDQHSNAGDGFYARDFDAEHHQRQANRQKEEK